MHLYASLLYPWTTPTPHHHPHPLRSWSQLSSREFKTAVYTVIIINTPIGTFTNVARQLFFFFRFFLFLFCFCFAFVFVSPCTSCIDDGHPVFWGRSPWRQRGECARPASYLLIPPTKRPWPCCFKGSRTLISASRLITERFSQCYIT